MKKLMIVAMVLCLVPTMMLAESINPRDFTEGQLLLRSVNRQLEAARVETLRVVIPEDVIEECFNILVFSGDYEQEATFYKNLILGAHFESDIHVWHWLMQLHQLRLEQLTRVDNELLSQPIALIHIGEMELLFSELSAQIRTWHEYADLVIETFEEDYPGKFYGSQSANDVMANFEREHPEFARDAIWPGLRATEFARYLDSEGSRSWIDAFGPEEITARAVYDEVKDQTYITQDKAKTYMISVYPDFLVY
ncbi:MAG: hypothetical protein ABIE94_00295 [archaeon]